MASEDFSDATLVLLGHGTEQHPDSGAPVFQHGATLRRRGLFAAVREAFWKQSPDVRAIWAEVASPRVFVVPLFISEGYFSEQVIPRELGFAPARPPQTRLMRRNSQLWHYCRPVGTHARMAEVLLARARGVVAAFPFPRSPRAEEISLFVAGHGTGRDANSRRAVEAAAERLRALKQYAGVQAVFLDETPRIAECYALARTRYVVVVPFFMSDGLHVTEDIPVMLGEPAEAVRQRRAAGQPSWRNPTERHGKLVWCAPAAGTDPQLAEVILERVREAAAGSWNP